MGSLKPAPQSQSISRRDELEILQNPRLSSEFYERNPLIVARELLGKFLLHKVSGKILAGRIVETEAYLGTEDPCSHAYNGPTPRCSVMFGPPGHAYVYFIYGNHYCFNVVAHNGGAGAVLVRALEPRVGINEMMKRRQTDSIKNTTNGPGKLAQALGISRKQNGANLTTGDLSILNAPSPKEVIKTSPRIGIKKARTKPYRFTLKGNPYVSLPIPR